MESIQDENGKINFDLLNQSKHNRGKNPVPHEKMPIFDEPNMRFADCEFDPGDDPLFLSEFKATGKWPEEYHAMR